MKKTILLVLISGGAICCFGQSKFGVKVYQNTDFFKSEFYDFRQTSTTSVRNVNFNRVSVALNINKKNYIHELELLMPEVRRPIEKAQFPADYKFNRTDGFDGKISSYSSRYEISKVLAGRDSPLSLLLGAGINPYFVNIEYIPDASGTAFYSSRKLYGIALNVTPRIKYTFSERFSFDLNVPFRLYDLRGEYTKVKNPAIPVRQQKENTIGSIFFDSVYTVRAGLMYQL